jgi:hypothetical protein
MRLLEDLIGFLIVWNSSNRTINTTEHSAIHTKYTAATDLFLTRLLHTESFTIASNLHNNLLLTG